MNVNTILPGVIATPINQEMLADETISQLYQERIPLKGPGRPDELVKTINSSIGNIIDTDSIIDINSHFS